MKKLKFMAPMRSKIELKATRMPEAIRIVDYTGRVLAAVQIRGVSYSVLTRIILINGRKCKRISVKKERSHLRVRFMLLLKALIVMVLLFKELSLKPTINFCQ